MFDPFQYRGGHAVIIIIIIEFRGEKDIIISFLLYCPPSRVPKWSRIRIIIPGKSVGAQLSAHHAKQQQFALGTRSKGLSRQSTIISGCGGGGEQPPAATHK